MRLYRLDYLDSVRGIAASMVVFYHYIGYVYPNASWVHLSSILFNGSDAVSFFFVLSGFVLSYRYFHVDPSLDIREYLIKRFFRLFPGYVLMVFLHHFYLHRHELTLFKIPELIFKNQLPLWNEIYMIKPTHTLYIPGWTLATEMVCSLLLPFFILAAQRNIRYIYYLIPIVLYAGAPTITIFIFHFCLGLLLAYHYPTISQYNFKSSRWFPYRWLIAILIVILYSIRHIERLLPFPPFIQRVLSFFQLDLFHFTGVASCLILLWIINNKTSKEFLSNKVLVYIGKISYGIYLIHFLLITIVMDNLQRLTLLMPSSIVRFSIMLVFVLLTTWAGAALIYKFIELPFIRMGKNLANKSRKAIDT